MISKKRENEVLTGSSSIPKQIALRRHIKKPGALLIEARRGLTVIELMVASVIVAVLVSFLLGTYQRASMMQAEVSCLSNLRSIGIASLSYLSDRNGELFPDKFWYGHKEGILNHLDPSIVGTVGDTVYTCPAFKKMRPSLFPSSLNRTYVLNYHALKYSPDSQYQNLPSGNRPLLPLPLRMSQITYPSKMWMVTDCAPNVGTVLRDRAATLDELIEPHGQSAAFLFFDGHVEKLPIKDVKSRDVIFWRGDRY